MHIKKNHLTQLVRIEYDYSDAYVLNGTTKIFKTENPELFFELAKKKTIVGIKEIVVDEQTVPTIFQNGLSSID